MRGAQRALARAPFLTTRIPFLTWCNRAETNTFIVFKLLGQGQGQGQGLVFISGLPKGETIWPLSQIVLPLLFKKIWDAKALRRPITREEPRVW